MTLSTEIETLTDDGFRAAVLEADGPVLVDFTAAWCPPCRVMKPVLAELAAERPDLRVAQIDVDAHQRTAAAYGVLSMPTFILFRGGEPVLQLVGARPKARLARELAAVLEGGA
jgi:thioredoxin 1